GRLELNGRGRLAGPKLGDGGGKSGGFDSAVCGGDGRCGRLRMDGQVVAGGLDLPDLLRAPKDVGERRDDRKRDVRGQPVIDGDPSSAPVLSFPPTACWGVYGRTIEGGSGGGPGGFGIDR